MYDKVTTADIIANLSANSGDDYRTALFEMYDELGAIGNILEKNFTLELEETLKSQDYDSATVVSEALENAGKEFFQGINYRIKRGIERDVELLGLDATIEKYTNRDYKTASDETIKNYAVFAEKLNSVRFYY